MNVNNILELFNHIDKKRKIQILLLVCLAIITSFAEIISVGSIIPFFSIFSDSFANNSLLPDPMQIFINKFSKFELLCSFITIVIIASIIRLSLTYYLNKITYWIANDIVSKAFNSVLYDDYESHLYTNSSNIIATCTTKIKDLTNHVINPLIILISYGLLSTIMLVFLSFINLNITIFMGFGIVLMYIVITLILRKRLLRLGLIMTKKQDLVQKTLQEGLRSIRDIIIMNLFEFYSKKFSKDDNEMREATSSIIILSQIPRFIIETTVIIMIVTLSYYFIEIKHEPDLIPIIIAITVGAQRILPFLQQTFWSYSQLYGGNESLKDILTLLNKKNKFDMTPTKLNFSNSIELKNISFKYSKAEDLALDTINLSIPKGKIIGVVGKTGSGKSTLIDIIMGLIEPTSGEILVDNIKLNASNRVAWYKMISHVPQDIFLIDGTIKDNITLGINEINIDQQKLDDSIKLACLEDLVYKQLDNGANTHIGEDGSLLSGGQKQRIAIARALYKDSDIMIFDESTSALDIDTENKIIDNILNYDTLKTIIMITHKPESLENCDIVIDVSNKNISIKKYL